MSYYNVRLNFDEDYQLKPIRWDNESLMSKFLRYKDFGIDDVVSLNIMRMHKKVIHVSDIVLSNGKNNQAGDVLGPSWPFLRPQISTLAHHTCRSIHMENGTLQNKLWVPHSHSPIARIY